jgi:hypothetical protein
LRAATARAGLRPAFFTVFFRAAVFLRDKGRPAFLERAIPFSSRRMPARGMPAMI